MAIIKLSKNEQRRLSVFFTCIVVALLAWVFTMLSSQYNYQVKMVVSFVNPPVRRSFRSLQSDTVDATVQGNGWDLLFYKMNMEDNKVTVNLKTLDTRSYILLSSQIKNINEKRLPNQQIVSINPDTLYFDFTSRAEKRVPVKLQYSISYKRQFTLSDDIILRPYYVILTGPAEELARITSWKTDSLTLHDVEGPVNTVVHLQPPGESNMTVYPKNVRVRLPVSEFTEKTIEVPVKLVNNKNYYNVKIFPQTVKVTFTVALTKYAQTDEHGFEAIADLNLWQQQGYKQLPVKLTFLPPYCKLVNIEPQNLDFIVKE